VLEVAATAGVCSLCGWAHFASTTPAVRHLPPPYDATIFEPFVVRPEQRRARIFAQQARSEFRLFNRRSGDGGGTEALMRRIGYRLTSPYTWGPPPLRRPARRRESPAQEPVGIPVGREGAAAAAAVDRKPPGGEFVPRIRPWSQTLASLARCRWFISLDTKWSAGQSVAEASLLGVPTIALRGYRSNAEVLLPPELLLPYTRDSDPATVVAHVQYLVRWYDANPGAYATLSEAIRRHAQVVLRPRPLAEIAAMLTSCCGGDAADGGDGEDGRGSRFARFAFLNRHRPRPKPFSNSTWHSDLKTARGRGAALHPQARNKTAAELWARLTSPTM
jgi:hypothetical protein